MTPFSLKVSLHDTNSGMLTRPDISVQNPKRFAIRQHWGLKCRPVKIVCRDVEEGNYPKPE